MWLYHTLFNHSLFLHIFSDVSVIANNDVVQTLKIEIVDDKSRRVNSLANTSLSKGSEAVGGQWKLTFWEVWSCWLSHPKGCGICLCTQASSIFLTFTNFRYKCLPTFLWLLLMLNNFLIFLANCFYLNKNHMHLARKSSYIVRQYNENKFFSFETIAVVFLAYFSRNSRSISSIYPPPLFFFKHRW